jgi:hypothetical protein
VHILRIIQLLERWSTCQSYPLCCPAQLYFICVSLLCFLDHFLEVCGIDVVIDVAVDIGHARVFRGEPPLSIDDEFVSK